MPGPPAQKFPGEPRQAAHRPPGPHAAPQSIPLPSNAVLRALHRQARRFPQWGCGESRHWPGVPKAEQQATCLRRPAWLGATGQMGIRLFLGFEISPIEQQRSPSQVRLWVRAGERCNWRSAPGCRLEPFRPRSPPAAPGRARKERQAVHFQAHRLQPRPPAPGFLPGAPSSQQAVNQLIGEEQRPFRTRLLRTGPVLRRS